MTVDGASHDLSSTEASQLVLSPSSGEPIILEADHISASLSDLGLARDGISFAYRAVSLSNFRLYDISALVDYPHLVCVDLGDNCLTDLSPLTHLPAIRTLLAPRNRLTDPTGGLRHIPTLTHLDLSHNCITSMANAVIPNAFPNLFVLDVGGNGISDIVTAGLERLTSLKILVLSGNFLSALPMVVSSPTKPPTLSHSPSVVGILPVYHDTVSEYLPRSILGLDVSRNSVIDIGGIEQCPVLQSLDASYNEILSVEALGHCRDLLTLNLQGNNISDVEHLRVLQGCSLLRDAVLRYNPFCAEVKPKDEGFDEAPSDVVQPDVEPAEAPGATSAVVNKVPNLAREQSLSEDLVAAPEEPQDHQFEASALLRSDETVDVVDDLESPAEVRQRQVRFSILTILQQLETLNGEPIPATDKVRVFLVATVRRINAVFVACSIFQVKADVYVRKVNVNPADSAS